MKINCLIIIPNIFASIISPKAPINPVKKRNVLKLSLKPKYCVKPSIIYGNCNIIEIISKLYV